MAMVDRLGAEHLRIVYVTGPGADYLNHVRSDGRCERDFLTQSDIAIRSCSMNDPLLREVCRGLDSRSPALVFLFHLGPRAGDVLRAALRIDDRAT